MYDSLLGLATSKLLTVMLLCLRVGLPAEPCACHSQVWIIRIFIMKDMLLQDLVDQHLRDSQRPPIMQAQFGGKVATTIVCRSVRYRSQKEEDFIQV